MEERTQLRPSERDRELGPDRGTGDGPGRAVHTRGRVERHHGATGTVGGLDSGGVPGPWRALDAGAEQSVHHYPGALDQARQRSVIVPIGIEAEARELPPVQNRIRNRSVPYRDGGNGPPPCSERPQAHQRVATVVARASKGHHRSLGKQVLDDQCRLAPSVFHQRRLRYSALANGEPVEVCGLVRGGSPHIASPERPVEAAPGT